MFVVVTMIAIALGAGRAVSFGLRWFNDFVTDSLVEAYRREDERIERNRARYREPSPKPPAKGASSAERPS
jgi:hypothetical protein